MTETRLITHHGPGLFHTMDGPSGSDPLVLLHSLGCDSSLWDAVVPAFSSVRQVLRYDLRGHGRSEDGAEECSIEDHVDDLLALLDACDLPRATLVGNSVGGMIALAAALRVPTRVRHLVLCATGARLGTPDGWSDRMVAIREHGLDAMADHVLPRWFVPDFATRRPGLYAGYRARFAGMSVAGYLATCAALRDADYTRQVPALRLPTLVLNGEKDLTCPPAAGRELADRIPGACWRSIADAAHQPPVEQPMAFNTALSCFLDT